MLGVGEVKPVAGAELVKHLPYTHEDLSSDPRTHVRATLGHTCLQSQRWGGRRELQGAPWSASLAKLVTFRERPCLETAVEWRLKK